MLRLRSIFVGRLGHFCSVGQRTCRRTTLTAGDKWARLSGISCTTGPVCGAVGYDANTVDRWSARGGPGARFGRELPSSPIPSGTYGAHGSGSVMAGCGARWGCLLTGRPGAQGSKGQKMIRASDGRMGCDLEIRMGAPSAIRTRDLLLRRHSPTVALRCHTWPDVPFTCTNSGRTWPGVAQHLSLLAPRLAPQNLVSLAHVRRIERSAGSRENVAQGLPWWRPARRGSPRPSSAHCVPATGRATQNGQRVEAERAAPPLPPTSG